MVGQALGTSLRPCSRCCYRICIRPSAPPLLLPITQSVAHCSCSGPFIIARQNINRSCPCTYTWPNWIRTRLCHTERGKVTIYNCQADGRYADAAIHGLHGPDKWYMVRSTIPGDLCGQEIDLWYMILNAARTLKRCRKINECIWLKAAGVVEKLWN